MSLGLRVCEGLGYFGVEGLGFRVFWVRPPSTSSGIVGIYRSPNMIANISCGHY